MSKEDVASSKIKIGASFKIALAIAILCRCPPESNKPPSPIIESSLLGNLSANSITYAASAALIKSLSVTLGLP